MADISAEVEALWVALLGEPPCLSATPDVMLHVLLRCSPVAPMPADVFREALVRRVDSPNESVT